MPSLSTECKLIAEVTIDVAPPAVCLAGLYVIRRPELCIPLFWLSTRPNFKRMAKLAISKGCVVLVETGTTHYKIALRDAKQGMQKLNRTHRALNTPAGISWLMHYLSHH